ncbi:hypothetical protein EV122DRAFT_252112 [Schizophyllum commune]
MSSSTEETPSGEELPRLIMSWPEFVALLADRPRTPYFMQQQFLDENMTPWGADAIDESTTVADAVEPTLVTDSSREPRASLGPTERDPDVDLIQAFIGPGATPSPSSEVVAGVDRNNVYICNPWPEREPPTLLALYPLHLLGSSSANACGSTSSAGPGSIFSVGPGSEARLEGFKTAEQQIADAGRNPDCRLTHLCPICEEEVSKKSLLRGASVSLAGKNCNLQHRSTRGLVSTFHSRLAPVKDKPIFTAMHGLDRRSYCYSTVDGRRSRRGQSVNAVKPLSSGSRLPSMVQTTTGKP